MPFARGKRFKKGFTLLEMIIAGSLFVIFSTVAVSLITSSLRSYSRGQVMQKLRFDSSQALRMMQADINRAEILPGVGSSSSWIASGIMLPNPYGDNNGNANSDTNQGDSTKEMLVKNRLVVCVSDIDLKDTTKLMGDTSNYQIVEYYVKSDQKRYLYRRVYSPIAILSSNEGYTGFEPKDVSGKKHWLMVDSSLPSTYKEYKVIEMPGPNDEVSFTAGRSAFVGKQLENPYDTKYEQYLVHLTLTLTTYINDKTGAKIKNFEYSEYTDAQAVMK